jgi:hypothetical protein
VFAALLMAGLVAAALDPATASPPAAASSLAPGARTPAASGPGAAAPAPMFDDGWLAPALAARRSWPPPTPPAALRLPDPFGWLRRASALAVDALPSARALRPPLPSRRPVDGTLDATLAAEKGAAVLAMLEGYVGADRWGAALDAHRAATAAAAGPGSAAPLLTTLAASAGEDVAGALRGFLERPGAPLLRVTVRCDGRADRAVVSQEPLAPGVAGAPPWTVPACLRAGGPRGDVTVCALLSGPRAELVLPFCPTWLWPNAGGAGYYVTALAAGELPALWPHLTAEERLALAVDAALLVRRGALPLEDALALLAPLAREADPRQVSAALLLAGLLEPRWLPAAEQPRWRALVRRTFGARARVLGWLPRADDVESARALRAVLLPLVAGEAEEAVLAGEALALSRRWLSDRRQVPAEVAWSALGPAAYHGDQELFDRVAAEAARAEPAERGRLVALLGRFREAGPATAALALALDPATAPGDAVGLLATALGGRETRPAALAALRSGWDGLAGRLAPGDAARLAEAAARTACEPAARAEVATLLGPRLAPFDGGARALSLGLEEADACLAARTRGEAAVARLLGRR